MMRSQIYDASIDIFSFGVMTISQLVSVILLIKATYFKEQTEMIVGRSELQ